MTNTDQARAAAKTALDAYRELPGFETNDQGTALVDLIVDLMHYADTIEADEHTEEIYGGYAGEKALDTYLEERDSDEDTSDPFADMEGDYPTGEEPGGALPH